MDNSRLSITDTQKRILWTFLDNRNTTIVKDNLPKNTDQMKNYDKFEPMIHGLTSYELGKNMPRQTWEINKKHLLGYQLVRLIREEKKGKQLRKYYDITPIGKFTLLQKLDVEALRQDFSKEFSRFVPEIARHWVELEKIWGNKINFVLKRSLLQINWYQWKTEMSIVKQKRDESKIKKLYEQVLYRFENTSKTTQEKYSEMLYILKKKQDKTGHKLQPFHDNLLKQIKQYRTKPRELGLIWDLMELVGELQKPNDLIKNSSGTQMVEKTVIPFESQQIEISLFREYTNFVHTKIKQVRKETVGNMTSIKTVIPTSLNKINFDVKYNDIMNRLVFIFYYNLVRYYKESEAAMMLASWVWDFTKFRTISEKEFNREIKKDPMRMWHKTHNEKYKIVKEIEKASKKTVTIIQKDAQLQKMMNTGIKEIRSKFAVPKTISDVLDEING